MSKHQTLRDLVKERLCAAAEEVFALFARTIEEYEEENRRKQHLLDKLLTPALMLPRLEEKVCVGSPSVNLEVPETPEIKGEPENQSIIPKLSVSVTGPSTVCVNAEHFLLLQEEQIEHQKETQGEGVSSKPCVHSEAEGNPEPSSDTDIDDDWRAPLSLSEAQMEEESVGDQHDQIRDRSTRGSTRKKNKPITRGDTAGSEGAGDKHQCSICKKTFENRRYLKNHVSAHAIERPHKCPVCEQRRFKKSDLLVHMRIHTGEKPFSCAVCKAAFNRKSHLKEHMNIHTGEKAYNCVVCKATFNRKSYLDRHMTVHTGEVPYSCILCKKVFPSKKMQCMHMRIHRVETTYRCTVCEKTFPGKRNLNMHMKIHKSVRKHFR